ncbi:copper chaperone PCu(A)C [Sphingomonas donggukensis]|uniref:Copper chaperone PCu(A)C n=1 Tax=Sphingomonas donggukensis TaxID=2949093 RepID=A0ABY4TQU2_9SPHN|nr:copper chaperone PCu(A)C [Sphingomonas donggukensis]URW74744.1 copper chaperone PCu(A)C [Sphingomonas donggukensis]
MRLPLFAAFLLAGCGTAPQAQVDSAYIRLNAVPGRPAAAYFTLRAGTDSLTLTAVTTPAAARAELHESMAGAGGMMRMTPLTQVPVPAGASVTFAPAGRHVMLFDVAETARAGTTAPLTLTLGNGKSLTADAKILAAGDPAP